MTLDTNDTEIDNDTGGMCGGLTLIELVITISLAGILGIPVGVLLSEQLGAAIHARDASVAMNLARAELERLESFNDFCHPETALTASSGVVVAFPAYPSYVVTRIVSCQTGDCTSTCGTPSNANNGIKRVEIRVTKTGSTAPLASLITYRTKFVLYGS